MVTTLGCRTRASSRPSSMIDVASWLDDTGSAGSSLSATSPIETRVPRAVDVAECPSSDRFEQAQWSPGLGHVAAMRPGNRGDRFQMTHERAVVRRRARVGGIPVDWSRHRGSRPPTPSTRYRLYRSRSISSARRTSARCAALRAASAVGFSRASASSS